MSSKFNVSSRSKLLVGLAIDRNNESSQLANNSIQATSESQNITLEVLSPVVSNNCVSIPVPASKNESHYDIKYTGVGDNDVTDEEILVYDANTQTITRRNIVESDIGNVSVYEVPSLNLDVEEPEELNFFVEEEVENKETEENCFPQCYIEGILNESEPNIVNEIVDNINIQSPEIQVNDDTLVVNEGNVKDDNLNKKKRKKFDVGLKERKKIKCDQIKESHSVQPVPCSRPNGTCRKNCSQNFDEERRISINKQFWEMTWGERRNFVLTSCKRNDVMRRVKKREERENWTERRNLTIKYFLKDASDQPHEVCKGFFLTTIGYKKTNDRFVHYTITNTPNGSLTPPPDRRGKQPSKNKGPHQEIIDHIETFNPTISHYRREHAPNVRYLPSDVNIVLMHGDFLQKNAQFRGRVSYDLYRRIVSEQHISFAQLGHEECEKCEAFKLHGHSKENLDPTCETCFMWDSHHELVIAARKSYQSFSENEIADNTICFSGDMQKIIMLPRVDMFKKVLFTKRLIAYHETFAPVGKKSKHKPYAMVWHEGISGRNKEDNISALYMFLKKHRDIKTVILWLDNCSSQNKNWCLFTFLVFIINSQEIAADEIIINYFQPGHTFMSADSFHHQVEQSLKSQGKTYDFQDFLVAVRNANSGKVEVCTMEHFDFFNWLDLSSQHKLKSSPSRIYLSDIVHVKATRGEYVLYCKTNYDEVSAYRELDFLQKKAMKGIRLPSPHKSPCGFPQEKKDSILENLQEVLPENRKMFWRDLPTPKDN